MMACHYYSQFLENITSFFLLFFCCVHQNTQLVGLVFLSVPATVKLKQVRIGNNVAKLTTSARWRLLNMMDDHFLWHKFEHHCVCSLFSALWMEPVIGDPRKQEKRAVFCRGANLNEFAKM